MSEIFKNHLQKFTRINEEVFIRHHDLFSGKKSTKKKESACGRTDLQDAVFCFKGLFTQISALGTHAYVDASTTVCIGSK
jgi:hypothetical protein